MVALNHNAVPEGPCELRALILYIYMSEIKWSYNAINWQTGFEPIYKHSVNYLTIKEKERPDISLMSKINMKPPAAAAGGPSLDS